MSTPPFPRSRGWGGHRGGGATTSINNTNMQPPSASLGPTPPEWTLPVVSTNSEPPPTTVHTMDQFCDVDSDEAMEEPACLPQVAMVEEPAQREERTDTWSPHAPFDELGRAPTPLQGFASIRQDQGMNDLGMASPPTMDSVNMAPPPRLYPDDGALLEAFGRRSPVEQPASKSASVSVISWADSSFNASSTATSLPQHSSSASSSSVWEGLTTGNPHKRRFSVAIERPAVPLPPGVSAEPISGSILIPDRNSKVSTCSGLTSGNDVPMVDTAAPPPAPPLVQPAVVAKAELHRLYGKPPRRKVITSEYFHTWHDENPSHIRKWTALFVCPISAELFFAGRYGPEGTRENELVWFVKKATAEHAAAARAYDCFVYRDRISGADALEEERNPIGVETPYFQPIFQLPPNLGIPSDVRQKIMLQQEEIRAMHGLPALYR